MKFVSIFIRAIKQIVEIIMNKIDNLYEVSEIKNQFEKLQKKYQTHLPKVDPYLVYDLLLRQQKNPVTIYMYNIEVFTKQGLDANASKEYVYKKAGMVPAVYDKVLTM